MTSNKYILQAQRLLNVSFTASVPDASMPSTSARAMFPDPMNPTLYPIPALVIGSVPRRRLEGGAPEGVPTACGTDDRRVDVAGVLRVWAPLVVVDGVAGDDILSLTCLMT